MRIFAKIDGRTGKVTAGSRRVVSKSFSSDPAVLEDFYIWLEGALKGLPLGRKDLNRVVLSTAEAFSNALLHGNHSNPKKKVVVDIAISGPKLAVRVGDEGEGTRPPAVRKSRPFDTSGRGWELMHKLADGVSIGRENEFFWVELCFKMPKSYTEQSKVKGGQKGVRKVRSGSRR